MKIKVAEEKKMPRLITIPGKLGKKEYRALQAGQAVEVDTESGEYLIKCGFAEVAKEIKAKTKSGGDK